MAKQKPEVLSDEQRLIKALLFQTDTVDYEISLDRYCDAYTCDTFLEYVIDVLYGGKVFVVYDSVVLDAKRGKVWKLRVRRA